MENIIGKIFENLNIKVSSENSKIIKQINKYESDRNNALNNEHFADLMFNQYKLAAYQSEAEKWKKERERFEKLIEDLIGKLKPDAD